MPDILASDAISDGWNTNKICHEWFKVFFVLLLLCEMDEKIFIFRKF